jgi:DNA-binding NarL/FixJ family response regulator
MDLPSNTLFASFSPIQRIVLVEDSAVIRESLLEALGASGGERQVIGTAETEDEAFRFISSHDSDVAIIDINLRQGSGIGLLSRLRGLGGAPRLRIVYTNHYSRRIHEHCSQLGATHVLAKAGDFSELLEVLEHGNA